MEGMSLLLACHSLMFVKMALWSLEKYSTLDNELVIVVDTGAPVKDLTCKWLERKGYPFFAVDFGDVYKTWDFAVQKATREVICMIPQDFVFSPEWDTNLVKHVKPKIAALSVVINPSDGAFWGPRIVECKCCKPGTDIELLRNQCGPNGFDLDKFLRKVEEIKRPGEIDRWDWFEPFAVNREIFMHISGYYNDFCSKKPWPELHEACTFRKLRSMGVDIVRSLDSIIYHFGSSGVMARLINPDDAWEYDPWEIYNESSSSKS